MTIPFTIEQQNGQFTAAVLGAAEVSATASTRDEAVSELRGEVERRLSNGELGFMDVGSKGLAALAGRYDTDDVSREMWDEVVAEAYRQRDEQKAAEFPE